LKHKNFSLIMIEASESLPQLIRIYEKNTINFVAVNICQHGF
jgi:hypothetical protein